MKPLCNILSEIRRSYDKKIQKQLSDEIYRRAYTELINAHQKEFDLYYDNEMVRLEFIYNKSGIDALFDEFGIKR